MPVPCQERRKENSCCSLALPFFFRSLGPTPFPIYSFTFEPFSSSCSDTHTRERMAMGKERWKIREGKDSLKPLTCAFQEHHDSTSRSSRLMLKMGSSKHEDTASAWTIMLTGTLKTKGFFCYPILALGYFHTKKKWPRASQMKARERRIHSETVYQRFPWSYLLESPYPTEGPQEMSIYCAKEREKALYPKIRLRQKNSGGERKMLSRQSMKGKR